MVHLELHYINTGSEPADAKATVTLETMPEAELEAEAGVILWGNGGISVPPHSTGAVGPSWLTVSEELGGSKFFAVSGHTHRFATNLTLTAAESPTAPELPFYDVSWSWREPPLVWHDPPIELPAGGGFRLGCEFNNTLDTTLAFGPSGLNEEMCAFSVLYYPRKSVSFCVVNEIYSTETICCPGHALCSLF
jgi:hypothetical protein